MRDDYKPTACPMFFYNDCSGTWVLVGDPFECPRRDRCARCWEHEPERCESIVMKETPWRNGCDRLTEDQQ